MDITFDNFSVSNPDQRNSRYLLSNINLKINAGEFICIIGPSGAGKSTLVKSLIGQHKTGFGEICVGGHRIPDEFENLRGEIGYIRQNDIIPPELPAGRAFKYAVDLRLPETITPDEKNRKINEVLKNFGISHLVDVPISGLSGGESKRGSIAVQLLSDPKILLLDEATSGLDAANESKVMKFLADQSRRGTTILCITHHLDNIDLADKTLILNQGSIVWYGDPKSALEYFNVKRLPDIFQALDDDTSGKWNRQWEKHSNRDTLVVTTQTEPEEVQSHHNKYNARRAWSCFLSLLKRNIEVLLRDRVAVKLLTVFPLLMSTLILGGYYSSDFQGPILLTRKLEADEKSVVAEVWGTIRTAVQAPSANDLPADITPQIRVVLDQYPKILSHLQSKSADRIVSDALADRVLAAPDKEIINPGVTLAYLFNVTTIVALMGFVIGIREHVRERHIFISESLHGVPVVSYLVAKTLFIGMVVFIQIAIVTAVLNYGFLISHSLGGGMPEPQYHVGGYREFILYWLLAFATGMMGFLVSIAVATIEQAFLIVPILELSQIILGGGFIVVSDGLIRAMSMLFSPAYWAYRGIRSESQGVPQTWHVMGDYVPSFKLPVSVLSVQIFTLVAISYVLLLREERRLR